MGDFTLAQLEAFIVAAKAATYVGGGKKCLSYRPGSHDLQCHDGDFSYLDSYFGGTDFIGQEVVYHCGAPVWAMNYYGRILEPARIAAVDAGQVIQQSLTQLYEQGRFLGGFTHDTPLGTYVDTNEGDVASFVGQEWIAREVDGETVRVYELVYHGGFIKD